MSQFVSRNKIGSGCTCDPDPTTPGSPSCPILEHRPLSAPITDAERILAADDRLYDEHTIGARREIVTQPDRDDLSHQRPYSEAGEILRKAAGDMPSEVLEVLGVAQPVDVAVDPGAPEGDRSRNAFVIQLPDGKITPAVLGQELIKYLLDCLGEDPNREGLLETPRRVMAMYQELFAQEPFNFTTFDAEGASEMIIQSNIPMHSLCEHHMLPFMGTATVAYIPDGKLVGLSKLARTVKFCSRGLQNQERITQGIANMLLENLAPKGVAVFVKARHLCMELRGASTPDVWTTTSCMRGAFEQEPTRSEFLSLARR